MNSIQTLCETKEWSYNPFMDAVEEFVDSLVENASSELYDATAKRLLGENLTHDEIMTGVPYCTPDDVIIIERATGVNKLDFKISTDTQIKVMLTRLKLGRKGLRDLYDTYMDLLSKNQGKTPEFIMAKAGAQFGLGGRQAQVILTKMTMKNSVKKEHYLQMAETVLIEETPTNTAGGTMPDSEPTDGDQRLGTKKVQKRKKKKLEDYT